MQGHCKSHPKAPSSSSNPGAPLASSPWHLAPLPGTLSLMPQDKKIAAAVMLLSPLHHPGSIPLLQPSPPT